MRGFSKEELLAFLKDTKKLAILAVGNPIRSDDSAGYHLGRLLYGRVKADVYICEMTPEHYLMQIISRGYSHVIILDTVLVEGAPGKILIIDPEELEEGMLLTHGMPMKLIVEILKKNNVRVMIIGIIPKNVEIGEKLSPEIKKAIEKLSQTLIETISQPIK